MPKKITKNTPILDWEHKDGRIFNGTGFDLSWQYRSEKIEVSKLSQFLGTPERHKGWRSVEGGKNSTKIMKRYKIVRTWINRSGEIFTGTSYQLSEYVKPKQIMYPNRIERFALKGAMLDGWKIIEK